MNRRGWCDLRRTRRLVVAALTAGACSPFGTSDSLPEGPGTNDGRDAAVVDGAGADAATSPLDGGFDASPSCADAALCADFDGVDPTDWMSPPGSGIVKHTREPAPDGQHGSALRIRVSDVTQSLDHVSGAFHYRIDDAPLGFTKAEARFSLYLQAVDFDYARTVGLLYTTTAGEYWPFTITVFGSRNNTCQLDGDNTGASGVMTAAGTRHEATVRLTRTTGSLHGEAWIGTTKVGDETHAADQEVGVLSFVLGVFDSSAGKALDYYVDDLTVTVE